MENLPTPGLVGRLIRFVIGLLALTWIWALSTSWSGLWQGDLPLGDRGFWITMAFVVAISSWVVNEVLLQDWGWRPSYIAAAGAAMASAAGSLVYGTPEAWPLGVYLAVWIGGLSLLVGPAFLLAALLGTPGCEMRSYAHLLALMRGGDPRMVACKGMLDRLDHLRIFGRF